MKFSMSLLMIVLISGCSSVPDEESRARYEAREKERAELAENSKTAEGIAGLLRFITGK